MNKTSLWEKGMKFGNICGCHQRADRSYFIKGCQFPVCSRCMGLWVGYIIFVVSSWLYAPSAYVSVLFMLIMFGDWLLQRFGIRESTNIRRFITGILCGYGFLGVIKLIIIFIMKG